MLAGVDGCKEGWVVAMAGEFPPKSLQVFICKGFEEVLNQTRECSAVVVDMPIGLPTGQNTRGCDASARRLLGKEGGSRVFTTPPRELLNETDVIEFQRKHREIFGKGAGLPVWGIVRKLRDVDQAMTPEIQDRVIEFHPELAFLRLAGRTLPSKHGAKGLFARIHWLFKDQPQSIMQTIAETLPDSVQLDDFLDAYVGIKVGRDFAEGREMRLPADPPERDERGLRMEIWY